jgi:hypothetical protein
MKMTRAAGSKKSTNQGFQKNGSNNSNDAEDKIAVSPKEWAKSHKTLVKLLKVLDTEYSKGRGMSTRKLLDKMCWNHNLQAAIDQAEKEGYIMRTKVKHEGRKGNDLVLNLITVKGQILLDKVAKVTGS